MPQRKKVTLGLHRYWWRLPPDTPGVPDDLSILPRDSDPRTRALADAAALDEAYANGQCLRRVREYKIKHCGRGTEDETGSEAPDINTCTEDCKAWVPVEFQQTFGQDPRDASVKGELRTIKSRRPLYDFKNRKGEAFRRDWEYRLR